MASIGAIEASAGNNARQTGAQLVLSSLSPSLTIKLESENFFIWKNQLLNMIMANGLENFINGKSAQPEQFLDDEQKVENP